MGDRPQRERVYQNHHLDSTRWDQVRFRPGDVVVSTSYKAGTTWMQNILAHLVFWDAEIPGPVTEISPWIGMRVRPLEPQLAMLETQAHRRFLKSHLALDGLPYREDVKYIVVSRDARDVFMSLWNHYGNYTPIMQGLLNNTPGRVGSPLPWCPEDVSWLWRQWIQLGWFEWESDGWPFWSHLHHLKTWWEWRHLPNILLVHYNDLLADLEGEMRRVAAYLEIEPADDAWPRLVDACTFASMKQQAAKIMPGAELGFVGGTDTFFYKGTNRRWDGALSDEDLALYPEAVERTLSPEAGEWLEKGRLATGS
ncbi:MAG: sulfotransferase domain-containing protein [Deltaproteobacteria bacterium]|nr:sulfotransferase domain-containing protein [Deltaproteobacteria bacterium]MBW2371453.1 sulfotransferase domain-containing protein [Deltaproteobacteria bacterium]